jgi:type I restriction-modification system DNA methylase subunit
MAGSAFDSAFEEVSKLAATFEANEARYLSQGYSEAQVRLDFVDKFFVALGWDVNHNIQTNPYEQEVHVENPEIASHRRADYAFYLAPNFRDVRFYVETKKPLGDIATADHYFQTIRYGYGSKNPVAVLSDFAHLHILDCRYKPDIDTALHRAIARYHYTEYANREKFAEIYFLFSREAVANGSLENFAADLPKPRDKAVQRGLLIGGYQPVDESFLQELDGFRSDLAHAFKSKNPRLDSDTLTEVTQRTLDRLVFLRFLEDKLIEPKPLVESFGTKGRAWEDFVATSRRLDGIYNGIVFKHNDNLDAPSFRVDEDVFADICEKLSHINTPYDFNTIPIHILGSIYERFLGKVIVATDKRVRVEEKPEVRKAGGVYYTPEYIVRYIVENTVGKLIAGKTPDQIAEMRFADIACGSGSFLLGIYDLLLQNHGTYYNKNPGKAHKGDCVERDGKLYLSLRKKREILLHNIYGVDIDAQAVEVAQLSLYLKLLKDETTDSAHQYLLEFEHTAQMKKLLPDLSKNIVCGNSLIGTDILDEQLFPKDEERKLNPMNFEDAFPEVTKRGGFDAIVGNPPYGAELSARSEHYLRGKFKAATRDLDTYALFMEQVVKLTRPRGRISMIVPTGWYSGAKFPALRRFMACQTDPESLVNLPYDVFKAWVDTTVFVVTKRGEPTTWPRAVSHTVNIRTFPKRHQIASEAEFSCELTTVDFVQWFANGKDEYLTYADSQTTLLIRKIQERGKPLREFADVQRGVTPFKLTDEPTHKASQPAFDGTVRRYTLRRGPKRYVRYDQTLMEFKPERYFKGPRLLLRELISRQFHLQAAKANDDFVTNKSMQSILQCPGGPHLNYLLGVINSGLMSWYFLHRSNIAQRDDFPKIVLKETRDLPIARPDQTRHDQMVHLVEQMLEAKKQLAKVKTDKDKSYYERRCSDLDHQIDRLVYDLYGLTDKEIEIVEAASRARDLPQPTAAERQVPGEAEPEPAALQIELEATVQQAEAGAPRQNTQRRRRRREP